MLCNRIWWAGRGGQQEECDVLAVMAVMAGQNPKTLSPPSSKKKTEGNKDSTRNSNRKQKTGANKRIRSPEEKIVGKLGSLHSQWVSTFNSKKPHSPRPKHHNILFFFCGMCVTSTPQLMNDGQERGQLPDWQMTKEKAIQGFKKKKNKIKLNKKHIRA